MGGEDLGGDSVLYPDHGIIAASVIINLGLYCQMQTTEFTQESTGTGGRRAWEWLSCIDSAFIPMSDNR